ncbi:MAG TPA: SIMPL domain-containing protein [Candidatus Kapabacteria bacterium]|nr:SIMPL domain-containing protein [Candidatus Kapabacteria bacterium]
MKLRLVILLLILATAPAFAQRTVTVMADGTVDSKPDYATVTMMISAQDATAQGAFARIDESSARLIKALNGVGVSAFDIEQQGLALNPSYDYSGGGGAPPKLAGFHLMVTYQIKVRTLADLPKVIDAGSLAGASNVSIASYGIVNRDKLEEGAMKAALSEAREKAERLAEQMGGKLGEIVSITPPDAGSGAGGGGMEREEEEHRGVIVAGNNAQKIKKSVELKVTFSVK